MLQVMIEHFKEGVQCQFFVLNYWPRNQTKFQLNQPRCNVNKNQHNQSGKIKVSTKAMGVYLIWISSMSVGIHHKLQNWNNCLDRRYEYLRCIKLIKKICREIYSDRDISFHHKI
jgi:hypothetical protein